MLNIVLLGILFILIAICIVVKSKHRIILTSLFILIGMYFGFVWGFGDSIIVKWQTQNILHAKKQSIAKYCNQKDLRYFISHKNNQLKHMTDNQAVDIYFIIAVNMDLKVSEFAEKLI
ncbi:hypothetical protein [Apilactobacillus ozensis]|uniref:hypothetical protein n=1 Tax=Apilactobacillus ozensis TaxID=866801 RepID=UPI0006CFD27E|nr:hypothetical protein [Apilactobacillus ozensis]